jgi:hypothetical protein
MVSQIDATLRLANQSRKKATTQSLDAQEQLLKQQKWIQTKRENQREKRTAARLLAAEANVQIKRKQWQIRHQTQKSIASAKLQAQLVKDPMYQTPVRSPGKKRVQVRSDAMKLTRANQQRNRRSEVKTAVIKQLRMSLQASNENSMLSQDISPQTRFTDKNFMTWANHSEATRNEWLCSVGHFSQAGIDRIIDVGGGVNGVRGLYIKLRVCNLANIEVIKLVTELL